MEGSNWALVGVETTVIGMCVVFLILIILMFCIIALDKAVDRASKKQIAGTAKNELPAAAAAPALAAATKSAASTGLDPKKVAAIMAAVTAAAGGKALKFVAIKRANNVPGPWAASAANEIINTRQSYL